MNKRQNSLIILVMGLLMFFISMTILAVGRSIFGADASILWAMGMLTYISLQGIVNGIQGILNRGSTKNKKKKGVNQDG